MINFQKYDEKNVGWIPVHERLPEMESYYLVKYANGEEDEKPFRIRPSKNILGFMTLEKITHWAHLYTPQ